MYFVRFTCFLLCFVPLFGYGSSTTSEFLKQNQFSKDAMQTLWLSPEQQKDTAEILSHPYAGIRVRYWHNQDRLGFVLNEIGKELPITYGIVLDNEGIHHFEVLAFRESRGDEIKNLGFRKQFLGAKLTGDGELSNNIDGISGATYSVRSMKKVAKLALYLQQQIQKP